MFVGSGEFMPTPDLALSVRKVTRAGSTRIAEAAFALAARRRKKVTAVHKANVLRISDGLFLESVRGVASRFAAVAYEESRMDPAARSEAGATGLLQLMPATARELRLDSDDPAVNVLAGARYLRQLLGRFGSVDLALAAYNAGPTAVERAGAAPSVSTLRYVANVERRAASLSVC